MFWLSSAEVSIFVELLTHANRFQILVYIIDDFLSIHESSDFFGEDRLEWKFVDHSGKVVGNQG